MIKETFVTEINKLISVYGSISYFGEKNSKIAKIVSSSNLLKFNIKKDTIKKSLDFQLTKTNRKNVTLIDKKIHNFFHNKNR